jgi:hypothetical protein
LNEDATVDISVHAKGWLSGPPQHISSMQRPGIWS